MITFWDSSTRCSRAMIYCVVSAISPSLPSRAPLHRFGFEFIETFVEFLQIHVDQFFNVFLHSFAFNELSLFMSSMWID
jgi:queuine/archaeosine tRNA-ribosyltransferase